MWGCLEEVPVAEPVASELERNVAAAAAALRAIDRRLAEAGAGASLADLARMRSTVRGLLDGVDAVVLRDVCVAVEHLTAGMRALEAALVVARRLSALSGVPG